MSNPAQLKGAGHLAVRWSALALSVLLAAACSPSLPVDPTPHEAIPAPGSIHLTSEPPQAPRALSLRYLYRGEPSGVSDEFMPGATVVVDRSLLPEPHGVEVNGQRCEGEFGIATGVETDLILILSDAGCTVTTVRTHPQDAQPHGNEAAYLFGRAPLGSHITVRPADPGLVTAPRTVPADETGYFSIESLPAGRYEVALVVGDQVVETVDIVLGAGEERYLTLSVPTE